MRWILVLAVVAAACFVTNRFASHHTGSNVFETLYMHLMPTPLVHPGGEHGEDGAEGIVGAESEVHAGAPLLEVPLPGFPAAFDYRGGDQEGGVKTVLYNLQVFQFAAVLLCFLCFLGVPRYVRTGKGDHASRMFAGFAMWVRDEMVYPVMGRQLGRKFLPYFLTLFFFILFMNVMGLVPFTLTPTACIWVTAGLAITTLVAMIVCGMVAQGPAAFWKNIVPHVPAPMLILMYPVEIIGMMVKPFALTIRLFANMTAGHMVVLSFMGLIFFFSGMWGDVGGWGSAPFAVAFAVFIMIIEAFVALLQAYIFTQLSIIFIGASIHPEH